MTDDLTPEERDTADLLTSPKRKREREQWAHQCLREWKKRNPHQLVRWANDKRNKFRGEEP